MRENELPLRIDETLKTFTAWLNSRDAVRYRPVIFAKDIYQPHDDIHVGELTVDPQRDGGLPQGTYTYRQDLLHYGREGSEGWGVIHYAIFPQKNGIIVTLRWVRETSGAVWDLLEKIALRWPDTCATVSDWQATEDGKRAQRWARWEHWWGSPEVLRTRAQAAEATQARYTMTRAQWGALSYPEQYQAVLHYFDDYTPEQITAWKPALDSYMRQYFARIENFADWDRWVCRALETYPAWAQQMFDLKAGYVVNGRHFTRAELQRWGGMSENERRDWITQGGPFRLNEVAWDDLPEEKRAEYEQARTEWGRLSEQEDAVIAPSGVQAGSAGVITDAKGLVLPVDMESLALALYSFGGSVGKEQMGEFIERFKLAQRSRDLGQEQTEAAIKARVQAALVGPPLAAPEVTAPVGDAGDAIPAPQSSPPGAPRDELYDQAFRLIEKGSKTIAEAWGWYCEQLGISQDKEDSKRAFKQAMRRRRKHEM